MGVILETAQTFAKNGVISEAECGKLLAKALEDGKISYGERTDLLKVQSSFGAKLTPKAENAIRKFLALGPVFDGSLAGRIFGVDDDTSERLEKAGITTPQELLLATRKPSERKALAKTTKLDRVELTHFAERADLARVLGIGKKYATVLDRIGVNNVQTLAKQDGTKLYNRIKDFLATAAGKKIAKRAPAKASVRKWITNSQILPFVLRYAGDAGANFSMTAYNALSAAEKGRLILGMNVKIDGSTIFEQSSLTREPVARRTSAIKTFMDKAVKHPSATFGADYLNDTDGDEFNVENGMDAKDLTRVKVGDETVGYHASFDVFISDDQEYGWEGQDTSPEYGGVLNVALDTKGNILEVDFEDTYDRYGGAEW